MESPFNSPTFERDGSFKVDEPVGAMSISPSGRDVVLASRRGLHIIDLDNPYDPPRYIQHETGWEVADVQWSPFASRDHWVVSTSNHVALVWNLHAATAATAIDHALHGREGHNRAITDINFSAHDPDMVATCGVDSFVYTWDLRQSQRPVQKYADWKAGAQQVKFNRKNPHILASAHNDRLHIWDDRKGASPLHTIKAHATKIYGIDWSRSEAMSILTCSLDKTIKLWNLADQDLKPHRIMRVGYQVWRARHTPFGMGILAMPHRDDFSVQLYDRRTYRISDRDSSVEPIHRFSGHRSNVREFLWRPRGVIEDSRDHRDFQLVTWGSDNQLLLHRVNDDLLSKVGYTKGAHFPDGDMNFTRRGAVYRSFHNVKSLQKRRDGAGLVSHHGERPVTADKSRQDSLRTSHSDGITPPRSRKGQVDALTWIKGVKIHKFDDITGHRARDPSVKTGNGVWTEPDELGAEIAWVAEKLPTVEIKEPDMRARRCVVAFDAPWTEEGKKCWVKCAIHFPPEYPASKEEPDYDFDWPASISEATKTRLSYQLQALLIAYANAGRGSLEAALRFLLGQRTFEQSSTIDFYRWYSTDAADGEMLAGVADHDEEEEDEAVESVGSINVPDLDHSGMVGNAPANLSNTNVPLPKACGAVFAPNGTLVCFFPRKKAAVLDSFIPKSRKLEERHDSEAAQAFEEFHRLNFGPGALTSHHSVSSSSSSDEDEETSPIMQHNPTVTYGKGFPAHFTLRQDHFLDDEAKHNDTESPTPASYVVLHKLDDILPCHISLAQGYKIVGPGDHVCNHNAEVAKKFGFEDIANTWERLAILLARNVPLRKVTLFDGSDALVVDHQALSEHGRPNSAVGQLDEDANSEQGKVLRGRVKWFGHPFGGVNLISNRPSLIQSIIEKYEAVGDVQMLGMLACILAPVPPGLSESAAKRYPSYNPPYYASIDAANSVLMAKQMAAGSRSLPRPPRAPQALPASKMMPLGQSISPSMPSSWSRSLAWLTSTPNSPQTPAPALFELTSDDDDTDEDQSSDSDADLLLPPPTSKVVVRLTNQDKFEEGATEDFPFLNNKDDDKHRAWRFMYANQLQAWGMFTARCQVLKFGGPKTIKADGVDQYRSRLFLRCASCGAETEQPTPAASNTADTPTAPARAAHKTCSECRQPLRLPACTLCWQTIRGLAVPCLLCGHVTHDACLRQWHAEGGADARMCAAGCGCECFGLGAGHGRENEDGFALADYGAEEEWSWEGIE